MENYTICVNLAIAATAIAPMQIASSFVVNRIDVMRIRALIKALGGPTRVSEVVNVGVQAISNWSTRNDIPREHHLTIWRLAVDKGVDWRPPNSERFSPTVVHQQDEAA